MPHTIVLSRVRAEYLEMPGMRLTLEQAQRLCGIERALCQTVLGVLVAEQFLCVTAEGRYARAGDGEKARYVPAKAALEPATHFVRAS